MNKDFRKQLKNILENASFDTADLTDEMWSYFEQAFTHKTYVNEHKGTKSYQYLEFLGDAVLQFLVSNAIFWTFPNDNEGHATALRSAIVDRENLGRLANELKLVDCVRASKGAYNNGKTIKADSDLFESFVGAIYCVYGLGAVESFIEKVLLVDLENFSNSSLKDPKSRFQELVQTSGKNDIFYENTALGNGLFESRVMIDKCVYGIGIGKTKKEAEKAAATEALKKYQQ
ncbi:ribonuclease III [Metamycoplasma neophronis]|uniref:Ribonuclease 3 n=1 Tax=Metamycoplasma neophronis TaxID=872983 RepID=A0ABY2Z1Q4_9BACT|nr:ribonuclease III [Metamycoplasma neophronis]TPR54739.1 ribonuclease III [Metamycoplasma neophronis]